MSTARIRCVRMLWVILQRVDCLNIMTLIPDGARESRTRRSSRKYANGLTEEEGKLGTRQKKIAKKAKILMRVS